MDELDTYVAELYYSNFTIVKAANLLFKHFPKAFKNKKEAKEYIRILYDNLDGFY